MNIIAENELLANIYELQEAVEIVVDKIILELNNQKLELQQKSKCALLRLFGCMKESKEVQALQFEVDTLENFIDVFDVTNYRDNETFVLKNSSTFKDITVEEWKIIFIYADKINPTLKSFKKTFPFINEYFAMFENFVDTAPSRTNRNLFTGYRA